MFFAPRVPEIDVATLRDQLASPEAPILLDIRPADERAISNIGGTHIPMNELEDRLDELDRKAQTVVYCRSGARSAAVVKYLQHCGFDNVANLKGGINAWSREIDASIRAY